MQGTEEGTLGWFGILQLEVTSETIWSSLLFPALLLASFLSFIPCAQYWRPVSGKRSKWGPGRIDLLLTYSSSCQRISETLLYTPGIKAVPLLTRSLKSRGKDKWGKIKITIQHNHSMLLEYRFQENRACVRSPLQYPLTQSSARHTAGIQQILNEWMHARHSAYDPMTVIIFAKDACSYYVSSISYCWALCQALFRGDLSSLPHYHSATLIIRVLLIKKLMCRKFSSRFHSQ